MSAEEYRQRTRDAFFARLSRQDMQNSLQTSHSENETDGECLEDGVTRLEPSAASVERPLDATNRGFQMMLKMGWKQETPLGKRADGLQEPLNVIAQPFSASIHTYAGLGKAAEEDDRLLAADLNRTPKHLRPDAALFSTNKAAAPPSETRADMPQVFPCLVCNKRYKRLSDLENHLSGYEHHHKLRLAEMTKQHRRPAKKRPAEDSPDGMDPALLKRIKALENASLQQESDSTTEAQPSEQPQKQRLSISFKLQPK